ncbi:hypothetical protein JCM16303_006000 [Sporobolomyces ruberrimus]
MDLVSFFQTIPHFISSLTLIDLFNLLTSLIFLRLAQLDTQNYPTPRYLGKGNVVTEARAVEVRNSFEYLIDCGRFFKRGLWINKFTVWIVTGVVGLPIGGGTSRLRGSVPLAIILLLRWTY